MLQVGAGTGLLYLIRWFWWRVTAWCEIVAMVGSFLISILFLALRKVDIVFGTHQQLLMTVIGTTICWLVMAYLGPQTDRQTLIDFYKKVHPLGPGWRPIRIAAGVTRAEAAAYAGHDNVPLALLGWVTGSLMIWSSLFTVGNFLYGRMNYALALAAVAVASGSTVIWVVRRLWK
jgi:hypothetical protein